VGSLEHAGGARWVVPPAGFGPAEDSRCAFPVISVFLSSPSMIVLSSLATRRLGTDPRTFLKAVLLAGLGGFSRISCVRAGGFVHGRNSPAMNQKKGSSRRRWSRAGPAFSPRTSAGAFWP